MARRARVPWRVELGRRLRHEREDRGWSRSRLAGRLRAVPGDDRPPEVKQLVDMIAQWERGDHAPGTDYRRRYHHVYGVDELTLFGEYDQAHEPSSLTLADVDGDVDRERLVAVNARPALLDRGAVAALGLVLAQQRRLEDVVGSAHMAGPARAHLTLVVRLLREARAGDAVGRALAAVGSDASQFVGWLNVATGEHDAAGPLYDQSLRLGLQAGDQELAATALSMRGHLAWVTDDLGEMAALSRAARELAGSPATRATAAQQEGRALALTGDRAGALRAVGEAEDALTGGGADDPDLLYFSGPGLLLAQRGLILAYLAETPAQHAEAADVIARGVAALPPEVRDAGWFAWYRVQMARERARGGEVSEGASQLRTVLGLAGSDKTRAEVKELHGAMAGRWPDDEEVNELGQALAAQGC